MSKETKELQTQGSTAVGQVLDFSSDAGAGLEGADKNSFAIPFLTVLQSMSPQCEPVKDGGIEGAEAGRFINSITNELYDEVHVIPCGFSRQFLRWAPRSSGGGYKGAYPAHDVDLRKINGLSEVNGYLMMDVPEGQNPFEPDGRPKFDILTDTRNHFVLVKNAAGSWIPALLSLSSTQIKKSKRWMSLIQGIEMKDASNRPFTPPSFSHVYKITAVKEENSKGKWHGIVVELEGQVDNGDVYAKAKKFHQEVASGQVEVQPPTPDEAGSTGSSNEQF